MGMNETGVWPELARGVPKGLEHGLRNFWYPVLQSHELPPDRPVAVKCLNENLVAFRDARGKPGVLVDRCPHRYVKLSAGRVLDGELQCALHGLRFTAAGECSLIPWEPEDSRLCGRMGARAYRAEEIGGFIWSYLGDEARFPPPPIEASIPEELLQPDRYVTIALPTDVWEANWLQVVDGSDAYHAVTLHAQSQLHGAVLQYIDPEVAEQFHAASTTSTTPAAPLAERRVKIVDTEGHGLRAISVDRHGNHLDHGHRLESYRGERFNLPALFSNVLHPVGNVTPYVSRLFKVPIDYGTTRLFRYAAWRAQTEEQRARCRQLFEKVVRIRQLKTAAEDKMMAAAAGDLVEARNGESLLAPDRDVVRIRKRIADAFLAQQLLGTRIPDSEPTPTAASLVFPI